MLIAAPSPRPGCPNDANTLQAIGSESKSQPVRKGSYAGQDGQIRVFAPADAIIRTICYTAVRQTPPAAAMDT